MERLTPVKRVVASASQGIVRRQYQAARSFERMPVQLKLQLLIAVIVIVDGSSRDRPRTRFSARRLLVQYARPVEFLGSRPS